MEHDKIITLFVAFFCGIAIGALAALVEERRIKKSFNAMFPKKPPVLPKPSRKKRKQITGWCLMAFLVVTTLSCISVKVVNTNNTVLAKAPEVEKKTPNVDISVPLTLKGSGLEDIVLDPPKIEMESENARK